MVRQEIKSLTFEEKVQLNKQLDSEEALEKSRIIDEYYPDSGPLSRFNYDKHLAFFKAGETFMERAAIAGNRTGKTTLSCYETTLHLTGDYPDWWEGRRFSHPVDWWAASDTGETTRDILQKDLLGPPGYFGTAMIPRASILGDPTHRRGIAGAIDTVNVRHKSGGVSTLGFKSYDQGRAKFQGTKKHGISLDEEPGVDIYFECLTRLAGTMPGEEDGLMICTFTPLQGMSTVVLLFLNEPGETRFVVTMGMDHAPHLSKETKAKLVASFPPHERDARMNGTPQLGSGQIFPVDEQFIVVPDFEIPPHWPRGYSMDVGWNRTSVGWHAHDKENDTIYRYAEHYMGNAEPPIHAAAIKARGDWIDGLVDPAARGRSQIDGQKLIEIYRKLGLRLTPAKNAVEAGIYELWQRLSTGRYKVFASCKNFIEERRLYRRDEKGKIVKEKDHAMDDARYFVMSGLAICKTKPVPPKPKVEIMDFGSDGGWMR